MPAIDRLGGLQSSVAIKAPCVAATTANIVLDGPQTIDGIAVVSGNRVLVWNQTDPTTNGIYVCDTGVWGRDSDFNGANQVVQGTIVLVMQGAQYGNTIFQQMTASPVIGTSAITFAVAGAAALALASSFMRSTVLPATTATAARAALGAQASLGYTPLNPANNLSDLSNVTTARSNLGISATATLQSYLAGLQLSNDGVTPNTKLDVTAGVCTDDGNAVTFAPLAGSIDCMTVGANGLDAGALAASTWYHVFAIAKAAGATPAFLASTSVNAPTLPATYTLKRRIGSFKTDGSAHILAFTQDGEDFRWSASVLDVNSTNPGVLAVTATLSVPTGVNVKWLGNAVLTISTTPSSLYLSDLAASNEAPMAQGAANAAPGVSVGNRAGGSTAGGQFEIRTNTSAQIRYRLTGSGADVVVGLITLGWIDRRGRDA